MTGMLLYLASPEAVIDNLKKLTELTSQSAQDLEAILDTSIFDLHFFNILEETYLTQLVPAMITFGTRDLAKAVDLSKNFADKEGTGKKEFLIEIHWTKAYKTYIEVICNRLQPWIAKKITLTHDMATKLILNNIVPKIKILYKHNMLYTKSSLPHVKCPVPLFSVLFYTDLAQSLSKVSNGIMVLLNWFEPLLMPLTIH